MIMLANYHNSWPLKYLKFRATILIGGEVVPKRSRLLCARTNAQNNEVAAILCRCLRKT